MNNTKSLYHGHRFPPEIISHAVWLYHRFCLSFRDVEELLAERGVEVSYESIRPLNGNLCHWSRTAPINTRTTGPNYPINPPGFGNDR